MAEYRVVGTIGFALVGRPWEHCPVSLHIFDAQTDEQAIGQAGLELDRRLDGKTDAGWSWTNPPIAINFDALSIKVGDRVKRKRGRGVEGTVRRIYVAQSWPKLVLNAEVLWHGNVRYYFGRTDQKSSLNIDSLVRVTA